MFYNRIKEYPVEYLLLAITICLQFYRLGMGEIQAWDEALYCVRANACLQFGAWIDQTQYAVGGLYSSTHPPLGIWGIALGKSIFGDATFAPRLFVAFSSVISLIYLYKLAKQLASQRTALLSTILFGNAQIWLWYGHHAQLDVPMHATLIVTLYYTLESLRGNTKNILFGGIFFGIALLTKAFQPLYFLPFLVSLAYIYRDDNGFKKVAKIVLLAICIASGWYIMMATRHPGFFGDWTGLFSSLASGTYRGMTGKWWYYANQLIISYPFVFLSVLPAVKIITYVKRKRIILHSEKILIGSMIWLVFMLIIVSAMKTNMPHFVLFLSIPTAICSIYSIELISKEPNRGLTILSLALTVIAILWSMSEQVRMFVKGKLPVELEYDLALLVILSVIVLMLVVYVLKQDKKDTRFIIIFLIVLVFGNAYRWSTKSEGVFISGAKEAISALSKVNTILIIHNDVPHEMFMPQFAYYSSGLNIGWYLEKQTITMPINSELTNSLSTLPQNIDAVVIYKSWNRYFQIDSTEMKLLTSINLLLSKSFSSRRVTRQYDVYLRK